MGAKVSLALTIQAGYALAHLKTAVKSPSAIAERSFVYHLALV